MAGQRTDDVREKLLALACEIGAGGVLPTARLLREQLGVSNATLNAALDELAARGQVIRKPGSGVYVAPSIAQRRLALVVNPLFFTHAGISPFWGLLLEEIQRRATARGEALFLHFAESVGLAEEVTKGRLAGVLAIGLTHTQTRWIESHHTPTVAFAGAARCYVQVAMDALIQSGVAALAREGCRKIVLLVSHTEMAPLRAFEVSCLAQDIESSEILSASSELSTQSLPFQGWALAESLLASNLDERCGVLSLDDTLTQGFLMRLLRADMLARLTIATHANTGSPTLLGWEDRLIRLEHDPADIVTGLFTCLDALIAGTQPPNTYIVADAGFPPVYSEPIRALSLSPKVILPPK
jgi:DNA-binding MarR family transcriptional regulator